MKRIIIILFSLFFCISNALAQRIAVLEFSAGVGVSSSDVDGLSSIFTTYFSPSGYTLVERSQIDRVIDEQNFQRSSMTEDQMVRVGEILNLSKIVIGKINLIANEYNVDVRVVNVESGTIAAKDGIAFNTSSYRQSMKMLAESLADQVSINPVVVTSAPKTNTWSKEQLQNKGFRFNPPLGEGVINGVNGEVKMFSYKHRFNKDYNENPENLWYVCGKNKDGYLDGVVILYKPMREGDLGSTVYLCYACRGEIALPILRFIKNSYNYDYDTRRWIEDRFDMVSITENEYSYAQYCTDWSSNIRNRPMIFEFVKIFGDYIENFLINESGTGIMNPDMLTKACLGDLPMQQLEESFNLFMNSNNVILPSSWESDM